MASADECDAVLSIDPKERRSTMLRLVLLVLVGAKRPVPGVRVSALDPRACCAARPIPFPRHYDYKMTKKQRHVHVECAPCGM